MKDDIHSIRPFPDDNFCQKLPQRPLDDDHDDGNVHIDDDINAASFQWS